MKALQQRNYDFRLSPMMLAFKHDKFANSVTSIPPENIFRTAMRRAIQCRRKLRLMTGV